jgi:hypothetical protein
LASQSVPPAGDEGKELELQRITQNARVAAELQRTTAAVAVHHWQNAGESIT